MLEPAREFDRLPFPAKIERLQADYGDVLDDRIEHITSLFQARNCIVHRLGVVAERDCNDRGRLVVLWRAIEAHVRQPDGTEGPAVLETIVEAGGELHAKQVVVEREFGVGDRVVLSAMDLCGSWFTIDLFGQGTAQRVAEFAKTKGFVLSEPAAQGDG